MDGWGEDSQDNIEAMQHDSGKDSEPDTAHDPDHIVGHLGQEHRSQADGHDPGVGNDIADMSQQFQRGKQSAAQHNRNGEQQGEQQRFLQRAQGS